MSDNDNTPIVALSAGLVAGYLLSTLFNRYRSKKNDTNTKVSDEIPTKTDTLILPLTDPVSHQTILKVEDEINTTNIDEIPTKIETLSSSSIESVPHQIKDDSTVDLRAKINKELLKIREIDKSPLELRKRFDNKGYVFITRNLATINTELNELVELMRKSDLHILKGCKNPSTCSCSFRHKHCRLFMIRKYSDSPEIGFFAPSCTGVTDVSPSNKDIKDGTPIHEFVQFYQTKFSNRMMDLVNYINFIVNPERHSKYAVDITLIADPCNYAPPSPSPSQINSDSIVDTNITTMDSTRNSSCSMKWTQSRFGEAQTNKTHAYDYIAMFLLKLNNMMVQSRTFLRTTIWKGKASKHER